MIVSATQSIVIEYGNDLFIYFLVRKYSNDYKVRKREITHSSPKFTIYFILFFIIISLAPREVEWGD
jgi:hypothetical protein